MDELRKGLSGAGCVVPMAALESSMRNTPMVSVPSSLSSALFSMATTTSMVASTSGLAVGGFFMKKVVLVLCVALVCGSAGWWLNDGSKERDKAVAQLQELKDQNEKLELLLQESRAEAEELQESFAENQRRQSLLDQQIKGLL